MDRMPERAALAGEPAPRTGPGGLSRFRRRRKSSSGSEGDVGCVGWLWQSLFFSLAGRRALPRPSNPRSHQSGDPAGRAAARRPRLLDRAGRRRLGRGLAPRPGRLPEGRAGEGHGQAHPGRVERPDDGRPAGRAEAEDDRVPHIEVDLARQVLFLVDAEGKVGNILPISSGQRQAFLRERLPGDPAPSRPAAAWRSSRRSRAGRRARSGEMHNPMYIVGGIAIHGSEDVPAYPASHGCIRIPMFASHRLPKMIPKGTPVTSTAARKRRLPPPEAFFRENQDAEAQLLASYPTFRPRLEKFGAIFRKSDTFLNNQAPGRTFRRNLGCARSHWEKDIKDCKDIEGARSFLSLQSCSPLGPFRTSPAPPAAGALAAWRARGRPRSGPASG